MQRRPTDEAGIFTPGTLLARIRATSTTALAVHALEPIKTRSEYVQDRGVHFLVRIISSLRAKPGQNDDRNPFLPYEPPLYVADASPTHVCILNKYKVADLHLLIVTREFAHQQNPLNLADFQALWRCLHEYNSLGFYNSGVLSGASQIHKHLQTVPLPLSRGRIRYSTPIEPLLGASTARPGEIVQSPQLPFAHSLHFWNPAEVAEPDRIAEMSWRCYEEMLRRHDLGPSADPEQRIGGSYNLLVTRRWMMLVPRVRECFFSISLNSLAFAGALLVQDATQLGQLRARGPLAALASVADNPAPTHR